jgi:putative membrane protein
MIVTKGISLGRLIKWSWHHMLWTLIGAFLIALLYQKGLIGITIPWLPLSVIGTAVAFYVGFKNNSAYDRMWEARKIWGAIVNSSRSWGSGIDSYVSNLFADRPVAEEELHAIKQKLIYRHIAWLYALRSQLLVATPWEHVAQEGLVGYTAKYYQENYGVGLVADQITREELELLLAPDERERLINKINTATQLINEQSRELSDLREKGLINDFRQMQLQQILQDLYDHQGKCERIKKFPLPRQYASMSRYFVGIFILLLPFSMIPELTKMGEFGFWISAPVTALIAWVYVMMEVVGDYSENPFQGMAYDIPMLSLCRVIEIDLREMLGETDLPPSIEAKNGVLM